MNRRGTFGRDGFLLAEALVAMAIGAFVLVALVSLVSLAVRASDRITSTSLSIETESRILFAITRDLDGISPERWAGPGAGFVFSGQPTSILFARPGPARNADGAREIVVLSADGPALTEASQVLAPDAVQMPDMREARTLQRRFVVRFAYFGQAEADTEVLVDRWENSSAMPVAIRVSLFDERGRPAGTVRVPVRIDGEIGCARPGSCGEVSDDETTASPDGETTIDADDGRGWLRYLNR